MNKKSIDTKKAIGDDMIETNIQLKLLMEIHSVLNDILETLEKKA